MYTAWLIGNYISMARLTPLVKIDEKDMIVQMSVQNNK